MTFFSLGCSPLSVLLPLWCYSQGLRPVVQLSVQRQPCWAGLHLAFWPDCWVIRWSICCEVVQVFFSSVVAECTPTGMLDSCSSRFFSRFKLGDTWTLHGLVVEGTEGPFIFHLETCVHFKLECKLGIFNGFSLAGQSNSSHRGVEVIFICESRRCRAELQCVLLVKHEPCWQCCMESGAVPWLLSVTSATNAR